MNILIDGELVLYGFVGDDFWDEGFTASDVIDALAMLGHDADITVRLNSGGGYTSDGIAIYNALKAHRGDVSVMIDAIAASAASVIAMAGDTITMREGALMMIHDPAACTCGDARDHEKSTEILNKLGDLIADIYAGQCGDDARDIRRDMQAELWLTGDDAVERGFATDTEASDVRAVAAFDYRLYAHAPKKLAKMARKKNWLFKASAATPSNSKAAVEAVRPKASDTKRDRKRRSAKMTEKTQANPKAKAVDDTTTDPDTDQDTATTEASATGAADAKARIKAILEDKAAGGHVTLARHLAFETDMPATEAIAALNAASGDGGKADDKPVADAARYQAQRSGAAALAQPVDGQLEQSPNSVLTASVDRLNKRR